MNYFNKILLTILIIKLLTLWAVSNSLAKQRQDSTFFISGRITTVQNLGLRDVQIIGVITNEKGTYKSRALLPSLYIVKPYKLGYRICLEQL